MLLEALVATTCLVEKVGCNESTSAYYESSVELQRTVKSAEKLGQRIIDERPYIVYIATPVAAVVGGQTSSIKLHKTLILNINIKQETMALQWIW